MSISIGTDSRPQWLAIGRIRKTALVLDHFASKFGGLAWLETDMAQAAFNTAESWSLDVTELVRAYADRSEIPRSIVDFIADRPSK